MNAEIVQLLNAQAAMEYEAAQLAFALLLWSKSYNWLGTHKALGRFKEDQESRVKAISKLLADYCGEEVTLPPLSAQRCSASGLPEVFQKVDGALKASQNGWKAIVTCAEDAEDGGDIEAYADDFLEENIKTIKRSTRRLRMLAMISNDQAALLKFDREMKGKDI